MAGGTSETLLGPIGGTDDRTTGPGVAVGIFGVEVQRGVFLLKCFHVPEVASVSSSISGLTSHPHPQHQVVSP